MLLFIPVLFSSLLLQALIIIKPARFLIINEISASSMIERIRLCDHSSFVCKLHVVLVSRFCNSRFNQMKICLKSVIVHIPSIHCKVFDCRWFFLFIDLKPEWNLFETLSQDYFFYLRTVEIRTSHFLPLVWIQLSGIKNIRSEDFLILFFSLYGVYLILTSF